MRDFSQPISYKEGAMRMISLAVTTLCVMLTVSPILAKDKKGEKPMDQQAMMELWKKLAMPGEPHKLFASLAAAGRPRLKNGWSRASHRRNQLAPRK